MKEMIVFAFSIMFFFIKNIYLSFSKKLLVLLFFEGFYIFFIFFMMVNSFASFMNSNFCLLIMVMMVLDSVLGISFLITSSRDSSNTSWKIFSF